MRHHSLLLLVALGVFGACDSGSDTGDEADTDTDTDADTDSDADTDLPDPLELSIPDLVSSAGMPREDDCEHWLPDAFTCSGSNPEITWRNVPDGASHLILIFDDPDAGNFPHWAIWDIPANETGLAGGISGELVTNTPPAGASEATNGFGYEGYLGSCPGAVNRYRWRLWAVDAPLDFTPSGNPASVYGQVADFARDHAVGEVARLCHLRGPT